MKGDIKVKRKKKSTQETVTFDPRLSQDKKTFVLVIESTSAMHWHDALYACLVYAKDELNELNIEASATPH